MIAEQDINGAERDATRQRGGSAVERLLDRSLLTLMNWNWETLAWGLLLLLTIVARFYNLGVRAMSHDESLHTIYSYYLYDRGDYVHNPMMHGPLKFHLNALAYLLFGHNDYSSRIVPAILGVGMVWMAYLYRRYLGRAGALLAGLLICVSPSLLFHSRYIRDDIYIEFFAMLWAYGLFRYLEDRKMRWLYATAVAMALGFVGMEAYFITGFIFGIFLLVLLFWPLLKERLFLVGLPLLLGAVGWYWQHSQAVALELQAKPLESDANQAAQFQQLMASSQSHNLWSYLILGLAVIVGGALLVLFMDRQRWCRLRLDPAGDLAVLILSLVLPFASPFLHIVLGVGADVDWQSPASLSSVDKLIYAVLVGLLFALAALLAWFWYDRRPAADAGETLPTSPLSLVNWAKLLGIFWLIEILFFTTFLTNFQNGLATGIVGSLGYWLDQQDVQRGSQPVYYYLMIGWLYEYLPIILTICGSWLLMRWLWKPQRMDESYKSKSLTSVSPISIPLAFVVFTLTWALLTFVGYTFAGEKMPWLYTHMATPICLFGGWWAGRLLERIDWRQAWVSKAVWLIGAAPALLLLTILLVRNLPDQLGRDAATIAALVQWLVIVVFWMGVALLISYWTSLVGWRTSANLLGAGVLALIFVLNLRTSFTLTYLNYDMVTEYLVYAHGGPDIKRALAEIDAISERTVGDRNIMVAYDNESSWPLTWYMRLYPNARFYGNQPNTDVMAAPVIIVGPENRDKVRPYVERDYIKRTYRLVWWPDMDYFNMTWERLRNAIVDPVQRERIWQIFFYRRHRDTNDYSKFRDVAKWPSQHEFDMYVKRDIASQIWDLGVTPVTGGAAGGSLAVRSEPSTWRELDLMANAIYSGPYGELPLNHPRAVAVAPSGNRIIADSDNHRIVILNPEGAFIRSIGSFCELGKGAEGSCVDPDGDGPRALGDGQFNQPWGVAVDVNDQIFVSDTWNGRIQVFDAEGAFLRTWGTFNTTNGTLGDPLVLFGPRGLAIGDDGSLLVADTGNKRILQYTPNGALVNQIGGGGVTAGAFDEPTALALDPSDGSFFVVDAWNRRLQKFGATLDFQAEWLAPSWESKEIFDKPYVAVAPNGDVYASDPQFHRIFIYNKAGGIKAVFGRFGAEANHFSRPTGLAIDAPSNSLLVADADNNRVMAFPLN
jgi:predicted membrane-bound mannosyltransferase/DNA-binding beta-propeller fold protein YncE